VGQQHEMLLKRRPRRFWRKRLY